MPLINIALATGRTPEQKRALMDAVSQATVDAIGASRDSIRVWITEFPPEDYMAGHETLAEKRARQR